jgi:hypothetical protein
MLQFPLESETDDPATTVGCSIARINSILLNEYEYSELKKEIIDWI